jgi:hypothetical protein
VVKPAGSGYLFFDAAFLVPPFFAAFLAPPFFAAFFPPFLVAIASMCSFFQVSGLGFLFLHDHKIMCLLRSCGLE